MKYYAQFYHLRDGSYVEGVGDRQLVRLDGRWSRESMRTIAYDITLARGYDGFRIFRGEINRPFFLHAAVVSVR